MIGMPGLIGWPLAPWHALQTCSFASTSCCAFPGAESAAEMTSAPRIPANCLLIIVIPYPDWSATAPAAEPRQDMPQTGLWRKRDWRTEDRGQRTEVIGSSVVCALSSILRRLSSDSLEILQVRRLLALGGRHQEAIGADHVIVAADAEMPVGFGTVLFVPDRIASRGPPVVLHDRPGMDERVIHDRHFVMRDIRILAVDIELFLDDGLVVAMQRKAGRVESTGTAEPARFGLEQIVFAVAVGIDPLAD